MESTPQRINAARLESTAAITSQSRAVKLQSTTGRVTMKRATRIFVSLFSEMLLVFASAVLAALLLSTAAQTAFAAGPTYDIRTLAGKVASVNGTAGLQIRFSAFIEREAEESGLVSPSPAAPITPDFVLSSPLDGTSVLAPNVTVNQ